MSKLALQLAAGIASNGAVPFARFMEMALYCPELGYYERISNTPGRRGDYHTSVSVGPLLGELLGFECVHRVNETAGTPWQLVEAGAQDGQLALDLLEWMRQRRPDAYARVEYWILEPSARRRQWQEQTLAPVRERVRWAASWAEAPAQGITGVILANELLDAFPVSRLGWDARRRTWFEWGVTVERSGFAWTRLQGAPRVDPALLPPVSPELAPLLPDGFTVDVAPGAVAWWREAARALRRGWLLALDYGLEADALLAPSRTEGTLRGYTRHHCTADVLSRPGEQDLTAHVNWTAIREAGESEGLHTECLKEQGRFLMQVASRASEDPAGFGAWSPERRRQLQTLVHPSHFGSSFQVLVQTRGG